MLRKKLHNRRGLTLVEMVATILCASLVALGSTVMVLTATRVARESSTSAGDQMLVRVIHRGLQALSENIRYYESNGTGWTLQSEGSAVLLRYDSSTKRLSAGGTDVMTHVEAAVQTGELNQHLLDLTLSADGHSYPLVIFCRTLNDDPVPPPVPDPGEEPPGGGGAKAAVD